LDSDKPLKEQSRVIRVAKGSGKSVREVEELLEQHKAFSKMIGKIGKTNIGPGNRNQAQNINKVASAVPASIMNKMGGLGGLTNMLKQMQDIPGMDKFKF